MSFGVSKRALTCERFIFSSLRLRAADASVERGPDPSESQARSSSMVTSYISKTVPILKLQGILTA
jgi:hypothetical protein